MRFHIIILTVQVLICIQWFSFITIMLLYSCSFEDQICFCLHQATFSDWMGNGRSKSLSINTTSGELFTRCFSAANGTSEPLTSRPGSHLFLSAVPTGKQMEVSIVTFISYLLLFAVRYRCHNIFKIITNMNKKPCL